MCVFIMLTFLKSFKRLGVKQKIFRRKFEDGLMWPLMTSWGHTLINEVFCLNNVGNAIHRHS